MGMTQDPLRRVLYWTDRDGHGPHGKRGMIYRIPVIDGHYHLEDRGIVFVHLTPLQAEMLVVVSDLFVWVR